MNLVSDYPSDNTKLKKLKKKKKSKEKKPDEDEEAEKHDVTTNIVIGVLFKYMYS